MVALGNKDYKYQTDEYGADGLPDADGASFIFLVRAQEGMDTAQIAGAQPAGATDIKFHLNLFENKGKFGLHPRYVEMAREIQGQGGSPCLVQKGLIPRKMVVLTQARFDAIVERNEAATPTVEGTQIELEGVTWRVTRKVAERRDNLYNAV
jgi:hypothetical protein